MTEKLLKEYLYFIKNDSLYTESERHIITSDFRKELNSLSASRSGEL